MSQEKAWVPRDVLELRAERRDLKKKKKKKKQRSYEAVGAKEYREAEGIEQHKGGLDRRLNLPGQNNNKRAYQLLKDVT